MKKNITGLFLLISFFSLGTTYAVTVDSQGDGRDCDVTGPVDTVSCIVAHTVTVYNGPPLYAGDPLTITVSHDIGDLDGLHSAFSGISCTTSGVMTTPCPSTDASSIVKGNGLSWGTVGRGASGQITPTLSEGSYIVTLATRAKGGDSESCSIAPFATCSLARAEDVTDGGTIVVQAALPPASVLLEISILLEKTFITTLSFFGLIDSAYAETILSK
jgi:hypothetical protein